MRVPLALITGASTGIGRATALRLTGKGWTVLAGVRDQSAGERLVEESGANGRVIPLALEVTDAAQIAQAAARVEEEVARPGASPRGGLDALVNNAGIGVGGPLELISLEDLRRQFEVNVFAQVAVTQAMLPALRRAGTPRGTGGRIVFVSSIGGRVAMAFTAPYAASKHAIEALGDALRVELRSSGVQVALVEPGSVATPIWDKGRAQAERMSVPPELPVRVRPRCRRDGQGPPGHGASRRRARAGGRDDRAGAERAANEGPLRRRDRREGDAARQAPAAGSPLRQGRATGARGVRLAHAGGGYTASQANRLVVAACVCSIPGSASIAGSVSPLQESR